LNISVSTILPSGQLSNIPWRRAGVKYTNNEAYFDVIEEIDAILDKNGTIVTCETQGYVSRIFKSELNERYDYKFKEFDLITLSLRCIFMPLDFKLIMI
jgi:hypothetical protein